MSEEIFSNIRVPKIAESITEVVPDPAREMHLLPGIVAVKAPNKQMRIFAGEYVISALLPKIEEGCVFPSTLERIPCIGVISMHDGAWYAVRQQTYIWMLQIGFHVQVHQGALKAAGIVPVFECLNLDRQSVWVVPIVVVPLCDVLAAGFFEAQVPEVTQVLAILLFEADVSVLTWSIMLKYISQILFAIVYYD